MVPHLVIVRRDDHLLYSYFKTQLERSGDAVVIQDRRVSERRHGSAHVAVDGRKEDRRTPMMPRQTRELRDLGFIAVARRASS